MNPALSALRVCGVIAVGIAAVVGSPAAGGRSLRATAAATQLAFSPASSTSAVGGILHVDVTVADVSNLGGYDLFLQFNPAIVHLTSLVDSGFVTTNPTNIVACGAATIDNTAGTATESCVTVVGFPVIGAGVSSVGATALTHATFTAVGEGTSPLTLTGSGLQDPSGIAIPATLGTGSISVRPALSVGGIAEAPDVAALPAASAAARGGGPDVVAGGGAIAVAATAVAGLAWRRRRRAHAR